MTTTNDKTDQATTPKPSPNSTPVLLEGKPVSFKSPLDSRLAGIETVYQTLAVSPALDIASNMFLGREMRTPGLLGLLFRKLDNRGMRTAEEAVAIMTGAKQPQARAS